MTSHITQHDAILLLLRQRPHTTNEIIAAPYGLASEYRARITELRDEGYDIHCAIKRGGASVWTLVSEPMTVTTLPSGQRVWA